MDDDSIGDDIIEPDDEGEEDTESRNCAGMRNEHVAYLNKLCGHPLTWVGGTYETWKRTISNSVFLSHMPFIGLGSKIVH